MKIVNSEQKIVDSRQKTVNSRQLTVNRKSGFTLLFAVLVSVLVIAVGVSMISIALKQIILSGSGRESQYAFYASNTGLECALYWDLHPIVDDAGNLRYVFPATLADEGGSDQLGLELDSEDADTVTCLGGKIMTGENFIDPEGYVGTPDWTVENSFVFRIVVKDTALDQSIDIDTNYCAEVEVTKTLEDGDLVTTIYSNGLNTCDIDSPRAVERGLVLQYRS